MSILNDSNKFIEFIENHKGLLAAIGIFAALSKYFHDSGTSSIKIASQNVSDLEFISLGIFVLLSFCLLIKCFETNTKKPNGFLAIFALSLGAFLLIIVLNLTTPFYGIIFSLSLFYSVFYLLNLINKNFIEPQKSIIVNFIFFIMGVALLFLIWNCQRILQLNDYLKLGMVIPSIISIFVMTLATFLKILKLIWRYIKTIC